MPDIPKRIPPELNKFAVSNNTFSRDVKSNPKDRITEWIGDDKQPDFKPQWKTRRWDEVDFSIRAEEHPEATVETDREKVKYITPNYEVHISENPEAGEDGGQDFVWVLKHKPDTNILIATVQTEGLNFKYQPELTQQEIDKGAFRPDNVIGSYAVYHATKGGLNRSDGMEYKTGKAFHWYRSKATDANGDWVWCDYNTDLQETGVLKVTIPQEFLDSAVYPVEVK